MPYVTSIERLARIEGREEGRAEGRAEARAEVKVAGKIQLLQELLGLPVMPDAELEQMEAPQLETLFLELRQRFDSR